MTAVSVSKIVCANCGYTDNLGRYYGCADCMGREEENVFERFCFRSRNGEPIRWKLLEGLAASGAIKETWLEASRELKSKALIGPAREGKTMAAKRLYNEALRKYGLKGPKKVRWYKERELFSIFRIDEHDDRNTKCLDFFTSFREAKPEVVFIDEAFEEVNWSDRGAERDKARLAHMQYTHFIDGYLYEAEYPVTLIITGNNLPEDAIGRDSENKSGLIGRFKEMCPLWGA